VTSPVPRRRPYAATTTYTNPAAAPAFTFANAFQQAAPAGSFTLNGVTPNLTAMNIMQYSLSVERELGRNYGLRVSYLGSKGTGIPYQRNVNQPCPRRRCSRRTAAPIRSSTTSATPTTSQQPLQRPPGPDDQRMANGLSFQSAWTWAKSLSEVDDNGDAEVNTSSKTLRPPP